MPQRLQATKKNHLAPSCSQARNYLNHRESQGATEFYQTRLTLTSVVFGASSVARCVNKILGKRNVVVPTYRIKHK